MRIALPNADDINQKNVVNVLQQVVRALEQEADLYGHHDTKLTEEVRLLREKMHDGFDHVANKVGGLEGKFDSLETKIGGLENKFDSLETKIGGLENKFDSLEAKVDEKLSEQTEILKMIAENTKK